MRRVTPILLLPLVAACQLVEVEGDEPEVLTPPPYPPGYSQAPKAIPDAVRAALPEGVIDAQVLKGDNNCYYYYQGQSVFAVKDAASGGGLCAAPKEGEEVIGPIPVAVDPNVPLPA